MPAPAAHHPLRTGQTNNGLTPAEVPVVATEHQLPVPHAPIPLPPLAARARMRRLSLGILVVELIGASALLPYALANVRAVFPSEDPSNWGAGTKEEKYARFGCTTPFDVFVLVPCYKVCARAGAGGRARGGGGAGEEGLSGRWKSSTAH